MLPAQRAELQKGRVSMRTGNLHLTKTIRSSHAKHEASSIDIVQHQRKFGKVNLRQLLRGRCYLRSGHGRRAGEQGQAERMRTDGAGYAYAASARRGGPFNCV